MSLYQSEEYDKENIFQLNNLPSSIVFAEKGKQNKRKSIFDEAKNITLYEKKHSPPNEKSNPLSVNQFCIETDKIIRNYSAVAHEVQIKNRSNQKSQQQLFLDNKEFDQNQQLSNIKAQFRNTQSEKKQSQKKSPRSPGSNKQYLMLSRIGFEESQSQVKNQIQLLKESQIFHEKGQHQSATAIKNPQNIPFDNINVENPNYNYQFSSKAQSIHQKYRYSLKLNQRNSVQPPIITQKDQSESESLQLINCISQIIENIIVVKKVVQSQNSHENIEIVLLFGDLCDYLGQNKISDTKTFEIGGDNVQNTNRFIGMLQGRPSVQSTVSASVNFNGKDLPRKSISLFSRMMKFNDPAIEPNKEQSNPKKPFSSNPIIQQRHLLQNLFNNTNVILQNIQIKTSDTLPQSQTDDQVEELLVSVLKQKYRSSIQSNRKNEDQIFRIRDSVKEIASCQIFVGNQLNQSEIQDDEWSKKYITSRRHQNTGVRFSKSISLKTNLPDLQSIRFTKTQKDNFQNYIRLYSYLINEIIKVIDKIDFSSNKRTNDLNKSTSSSRLDKKDSHQQKINLNEEVFEEIMVQILGNSQKLKQKLKHSDKYYQDLGFKTDQIHIFQQLLYNVWTKFVYNKIQSSERGQYSPICSSPRTFQPVFELLQCDKQCVEFLLYVIKEIQRFFIFSKDNVKSQKFNFNQDRLKQKANSQYKIIDSKRTEGQSRQIKTLRNPTCQQHQAKQFIKTTQTREFDKKYLLIHDCDKINKFTEQERQYDIQRLNGNQNLNNIESDTKTSLKNEYSQKIMSKMIEKKLSNLNESNDNKTKLKSQQSKDNLSQRSQNISLKQKPPAWHSDKQPTQRQHQLKLKVLALEQKVTQQKIQIQTREELIKKLMLLQQIQLIEHQVQLNNLQTLCEKKIDNVREGFRKKMKSKQIQVREKDNQIFKMDLYVAKVQKERQFESKLLDQANHIRSLKLGALSSPQRATMKKSYSALINLHKGCHKQIYKIHNQSSIRQISNITERDQSDIKENLMNFSNKKISGIKQKKQSSIKDKENLLDQLRQGQKIWRRLNLIEKKIQSIKNSKFTEMK